jgi:hypothetical protein
MILCNIKSLVCFIWTIHHPERGFLSNYMFDGLYMCFMYAVEVESLCTELMQVS